MRVTAEMLQQATGGRWVARPISSEVLFRVTTDSRKITPGDVFVALAGPRFDGHDFLEAVLAVPDTGVIGLPERLEAIPAGLRTGRLLLGVPDPLRALGDVAASIRDGIGVPVVGLTGSAGKTTTKDLIRGILEQTGPGLATAGNLNNLIGLPLTLLELEPAHRWVVLEMGMNAFGEIARMAEIARPQVRLITNIGYAHTEGVGGLEGVAQAKGELFATALPGDTVVVNLDDAMAPSIPVPAGVRRLTFGQNAAADVQRVDVKTRSGGMLELSLRLGSERLGSQRLVVSLPLIGHHNAVNATAAAAVGYALEVPIDAIAAGLEQARISPMRMQQSQLPGGVLVLNDAYNANPTSMLAALDTLVALRRQTPTARLVAVLGDMLELGTLEAAAHHRLGEQVAELGIDRLFVCGVRAEAIAAGARARMGEGRVLHTLEPGEIARGLDGWLEPGDIVLIKGSRGARMERVLEALQRLRGVESAPQGAH